LAFDIPQKRDRVSSIFGHFYVSGPETEYGRVTVNDRQENWLMDVLGEGITCFKRGFISEKWGWGKNIPV